LAKLKGKALVDRVYQVLCDKQWEPPQLRAPKPAVKKAPKKATKKAAKKTSKAAARK
jgi:hypothetical protein